MTQVIINDILPLTQIIAVGAQTVFSTDWTANYASDVVVYQRIDTLEADDATQVLPPSAYNVAFIGSLRIVEVTLVTAATAGDIVTITRMTPADRENLYTNTNFTPSMLNNDFGILTLVDQQAQLVNQQVAPRYNYSALISVPKDTILPLLSPGESWVMNAAGTAIEAQVAGGSGGDVLAALASHDPGQGASLVGLNPSGTVQDLANARFIVQVPNATVPNAQALSVLTTGILKSTTTTGILSISAPLTSIDGLTTAADKMIYTTASNVYATTDLTPVARTLLAQTSFAGMAVILGALPLTGGTMSGVIDMGNNKITNLTDPTANQDAATRIFVTSQLGNYLPLAGGTMSPSATINMNSGSIVGLSAPVNAGDAANKAYVDSVAIGLSIQPAVYAATSPSNVYTVTYNNGAAGIGATLTNAGAFAVFAADSVSVPVGQRVLIKNQASALQNGIYTVTTAGDAISVNWVLTRATDYNQPSQIQPGDLVVVNNGTLNAGSSWIETATVVAVGTDPINFSQFTFAASAVLLKALNLSDVASKTTSFNNLSPTSTKGDIIADDGTNDVRLAVGTVNGQVLQVNSGAATGLAYSTTTYPSTTTVNQILYSSATNTVTGLATVAGGVLVTSAAGVPSMLANPTAANRVLFSGNAAIASWSAFTLPSAAGTSGNVLTSDGTNFVSSAPAVVSPLTNKGDLYGFSTVNARLPVAVGNGKILQVDSAATLGLSYSTPTYPSASGTSRKIIVSDGTNNIYSTETYATPGSSGNVMTSDGTNWVSSAPGATSQNPFICNTRLTLTTGVPVTTADVTAATSVFITPYKGTQIALFDGASTWTTLSFTQITLAVPATTSTMYDVFAYNNTGTVAVEALAWTNDTTRATALVLQNGVYVKSGVTTRRYIGSFRTTTVSGQTEDSLLKRYVWNYYNRVKRSMVAVDTANTWTWSTNSYQQANANAANQLDFVIGVSEDSVTAGVISMVSNSAATFRFCYAGIGLDSTTANSATTNIPAQCSSSAGNGFGVAEYEAYIAAGRHTLVWLERGAGADTQTWYGDNNTVMQSGIQGDVWA